MTRFDRRLLFTSGAAAALLAATGVSAGPFPQKGGRLKVALSGATRTDQWDTPHGMFMQVARGAVFETLTEIQADGTLRGDLAQGWSSADGGRTWVFELAQDVVFHDGSPFEAQDVVATLREHNGLGLVSAKANKRLSVRVTLETPNSSLPFLLADPQFAILPAAAEKRAAGVGTGLYRVHKFDAGRQFLGQRVSAHRKDGREGWFDEIELVSIPSEAVRAEALRDGFVDVADVAALDAYTDPSEFQLLPSERDTQHVVHRSVGLPVALGTAWPLDNFAMARRWWKT